MAVLRRDHRFGRRFRLGVRPGRRDWLALVDVLAGPTRGVDKHRARVHELLDLEGLQAVQQAARAFDVYRRIERVLFAGKIKIGDEMDNARNMTPELLAKARKSQFDCGIGAEIRLENRESDVAPGAVETDDAV